MERDQHSNGPAAHVNNEIDLTGALRRLRGDRQLLLDLITFFLEDYPQVADDVHRATQQKSRDELSLAAHSLKGLAANFDAHDVVEIVGTIEHHAKSGKLDNAEQLVPALDRALDRLVAGLRQYREASLGPA